MKVGVIGLGQHRRSRRVQSRRRRSRRRGLRRRCIARRRDQRCARGAVGRRGGCGERGHRALAPDAGRRASGRRRVGRPPPHPVRSWSTCRRTVPRSCASSARSSRPTGHHLVEAPLTGGAIGAERRMLVVHGRRCRRRRRPRPAGARAARARVRAPRSARPRQHHEAGQQPHRVHHHLGEPRGSLAGGEVGGPGAAGRRSAAHQRRRQLLPRPHGREHRHPQRARPSSRSGSRPRTPASSSETGRALGVPTPAGAAVLQVLVGAIAAGLGDHDWADLVAVAERQGDVELHWSQPWTGVEVGGSSRHFDAGMVVRWSGGRGAEDVGGDSQGGDGRGNAGVHRDLHEYLDQLVARQADARARPRGGRAAPRGGRARQASRR